MRTPIIAGNWKMNKTAAEAKEFLKELLPLLAGADCEAVVCPPAPLLSEVAKALQGSQVALGAQNVHWAENGAFTGEVSADMLLGLGVKYVIIGHSERRQYFGETDETVNKRALAAKGKGLTPIVCVGETLEEREAGKAVTLVQAQTAKALAGFTAQAAGEVIIAYEPIWAIGTGKTATAGDANEMCAAIRATVAEVFGTEAAAAVRIQYGGSMNAKNAQELMGMPDIDGGLIGGASLTLDFAKVVNYNK